MEYEYVCYLLTVEELSLSVSDFTDFSTLYRAFTTFELKKKLCGKGFSTNIVEAVISDFQSRFISKTKNCLFFLHPFIFKTILLKIYLSYSQPENYPSYIHYDSCM